MVNANHSPSPIKGAFLGLLFPGLGFVYGGNLKTFALYNLVYVILSINIGWLVVRNYEHGIYWNFSLNIAWYLLSAAGAYFYIRKNRQKNSNKYGMVVLAVLAILVTGGSLAFMINRNLLCGYGIYKITGIHSVLIHGDRVVSENSKKISVGDIVIYKGNRGTSVGTVLDIDGNAISVYNKYDKQPISLKDVYGIVKYVWMSWDGKKILWNRFPKHIDLLK